MKPPLPPGWKMVKLEDVCASIADGDHQPPPKSKTGIPFLVISNVAGGTIDFTDTRFVDESYYRSLSENRVARKGDILITVTASYGIALPVDTDREFCFQRHIAVLKPRGIDRDYLVYALQSTPCQKYFDSVATGTAQKTVGLAPLRLTPIPLPPLAEQKAIVKRLDELLALEREIAADSTAVDDLVVAAKLKILGLAFAGKLVPNCGKWHTVRLGDIAETTLGKMLNRRQQTGTASPYLCTINVRWGSIDLDHVKEMLFEPSELKQYDLRKGDLLVCEGGDVGRATVWDRDDSYPFQNSLHRVRFRSDNPWYVQRYLEYLGRAGKIAEMCSGVTIKHFTSTILKNLEIPLPPLAEQKAIVAKVDEFFSILNAMKNGRTQSL